MVNINRKIDDNIKNDFKLLKENPDMVFLNSAATSLKPDIFVDKLDEFYTKRITSLKKSHELTAKFNDEVFEESMKVVADHLNTTSDHIVNSYGTTDSINKVALHTIINSNDGDEIILGTLEHASNILPWTNYAKKLGKKIVFKWYKLNDDWTIDLDYLKTLITDKTKLLAIASTYNTSGANNDIAKVREAIGDRVELFIDAAQSIGHKKLDVTVGNINYLVFGAHKAFGPHALGFIYIRDIDDIDMPFSFGGHMNKSFNKEETTYKAGRNRFIAGTQDIPGLAAFAESIKYIESIGIDNIQQYNEELKAYGEERLKELDNVRVINEGVSSSILFFEVKGVSGEDVAYHLSKDRIIVRTGSSCVKMKYEKYEAHKAIRASLHIYNTKEDIDRLVESIKSGGNFLDSLFNKGDTDCSK